MRDQYGREIEYMRISVTDLCNLRCIYCMPGDGVEKCTHSEILTYDEIVRVGRSAAKLGVSKIKLTGGEPLVRRNIEELVKMLKRISGIEEVTLTTNGILLAEKIDALKEAGLNAVNVSLDTTDRQRYIQLTRRDRFEAAWEGLMAAVNCPGIRVKVNCVALSARENRNASKEDWVALADLARKYPLDVRFIEMMPIGLGRAYTGGSQEEIERTLEAVYGPARVYGEKRGNGPAVYREYSGFQGKIGFISAMSHMFCKECNRVRLTSEGFLKPCLQYADGTDLRRLLRNGSSDAGIRREMERVIFQKPRCHQFCEAEKNAGILESREMSRIGG